MSSKRQREVVKMLKEVGLEIEGDIGHTGGGHLAIVGKAPNGKTRKFTMQATPSEWRGDKNQMAVLKRFFAENQVKPNSVEETLKELKSVGSPTPPGKAKSEFKHVRRLAPPPPHKQPNVFTPLHSVPAPGTMAISLLTPRPFHIDEQPPAMTPFSIDTQSKPSPLALVPLKEENEMPPKKNTPAPAPSPAADSAASAPATPTTEKPAKPTKAKSGESSRQLNRLNGFQTVDLADFLRGKYDWVGLRPTSWETVAEAARAALDFNVTAANVSGLAEHYKLALYAAPKMPDDPLSIIARHVKRLYDELQLKPDDDFIQILQAQGQLPL